MIPQGNHDTSEGQGENSRKDSLHAMASSTDDQFADWVNTLLTAPPTGPTPRCKIVIISTMRSGSRYFCSCLESTGRFGRPQEYFNPRFLDMLKQRLAGRLPPPAEYLAMLAARTTTPNGVFTVHLHVDHYTAIRQSGTDLLEGHFDRVLAVRRDDTLAQGLSYAKAMLSDRWNSLATAARRVTAEDVTDSSLLAALATITAWKEFYEARMRSRVNHEYSYEQFATDPVIFRKVLDDCGIQHTDSTAFETPLEIQREPADTVRIERFLSTWGLSRSPP